jgi:type II restriction enzyme
LAVLERIPPNDSSVRLTFDASLATGYTSGSQRARRLSEGWFASEMHCAACDADSVHPHPNNARANDFHCLACGAQYELKSGKGAFGPTIPDGAFASMMERIKRQGGGLGRSRHVVGSRAVPYARRHLAAPARRAGWVGCNIRIADIPAAGRIAVVRDGAPMPRAAVVAGLQRAAAATGDLAARSWFVDTLRCVERLEPEFTLSQVYAFEAEMQARHPSNQHVRPKLRQQLQRLRDAGLLVFLGDGRYRRIEA